MQWLKKSTTKQPISSPKRPPLQESPPARPLIVPRAAETQARSQPVEQRKPRQPCGPECWLKGFLEYPEYPSRDWLPTLPSTTCASDEERLKIAQQLYSPIWTWQTRLIKLHPGTVPDQICCDLLVVDLIANTGVGATATGEVLEYEAISYSWGYPAFTHLVVCNDIEVPVTEAMVQMLLRLRLSDRPRYLWIDALCMNQFDRKEKTEQVRKMLLIFQKSKGVIAWLGYPRYNDTAALHYLKKIATTDTPLRNDDNRYHDSRCATRFAQVSSDLRNLFSKPWFSRTWIRQEVFASNNFTLLCGEFAWDNKIFRAIDVWQQFQPEITPESPLEIFPVPNQDTLEIMRQSRIAIKRWLSSRGKLIAPARRLVDTGAWLEGLLAGSRFGVTDPRDKVYGIIGMLEEKSRLLDFEAPHSEETHQRPTFAGSIDYTKSVSEVYQDITKFLINRDRNLLPLCLFRDRTGVDGLPTWVLNCNPASRSWFIATHLTADSGPALLLQERFLQGHYGEFDPVDTNADGSLRIRGYHLCKLGIENKNVRQRLSTPFQKSLVTSPPLPDKGFFHTFIKDREMLQKECAYWDMTVLEWVQDMNDFRLTLFPDSQSEQDKPFGMDVLPKSMLVSKAGNGVLQMVLVDGSPLPLVLGQIREDLPEYTFLGPACWCNTIMKGVEDAPGYDITAALRVFAEKKKWEKEDFWLR